MPATDRIAVLRVSLGGAPSTNSKVSGGSPPRDLLASPFHPRDSDGVRGATPAVRLASVTIHRNEIYVEVQDQGAIDLVDRALILALLEAGTAAEKEGPHVTTAVSPATCYGKVRVSPRGEEHVRFHLDAARKAAVGVLTAAQCRFIEK